ncbi:MAG: enoyl-[acyl-carrier-protein] reductase FabK [Bacillota bacterium]
MRTRITEILGIKYPIFQGGMAWIGTGELAGAVSKAGGLGIIGAGNAPPEIVEKEIDKARKLTSSPFGVNVYYMSPYVEDIIQLVIDKKVPVITTGAGNPGKHLPHLKKANIMVFPVVASVALAKRLEKQGVDGIIAEGMECGGHVGEITTMALVPQIVDAVEIPVIAAGGIADGRGFLAAMSLGAEGIQMGTRFICSIECTVHDNYKQKILSAKDRDTVLTGSDGHYVRCIKNKLTKEFANRVKDGAAFEDLHQLGAGKLRAAAVDGDMEMGSIMAGQVSAMIDNIKSAEDIITEIVEGYYKTLTKLQGIKQIRNT